MEAVLEQTLVREDDTPDAAFIARFGHLQVFKVFKQSKRAEVHLWVKDDAPGLENPEIYRNDLHILQSIDIRDILVSQAISLSIRPEFPPATLERLLFILGGIPLLYQVRLYGEEMKIAQLSNGALPNQVQSIGVSARALTALFKGSHLAAHNCFTELLFCSGLHLVGTDSDLTELVDAFQDFPCLSDFSIDIEQHNRKRPSHAVIPHETADTTHVEKWNPIFQILAKAPLSRLATYCPPKLSFRGVTLPTSSSRFVLQNIRLVLQQSHLRSNTDSLCSICFTLPTLDDIAIYISAWAQYVSPRKLNIIATGEDLPAGTFWSRNPENKYFVPPKFHFSFLCVGNEQNISAPILPIKINHSEFLRPLQAMELLQKKVMDLLPAGRWEGSGLGLDEKSEEMVHLYNSWTEANLWDFDFEGNSNAAQWVKAMTILKKMYPHIHNREQEYDITGLYLLLSTYPGQLVSLLSRSIDEGNTISAPPNSETIQSLRHKLMLKTEECEANDSLHEERLAEKDIEIARLKAQLEELRGSHGPPSKRQRPIDAVFDE